MTQFLRSLIREALLLEEVYGAQATVYHGTKAPPQKLIRALLNNAFVPGEGAGDMYGKGLYTVHKLEGTQTESGRYGPHILKLKVKLDDYIIFDRDVATKVYGKPLLPREQALRAGLDDITVQELGGTGFNRLFDPKEFSSKTAEKASRFLAGKCKGIVYTGRNDGRCVLVYDPTTAVPMAWKPVGAEDWKPVKKSSLKGALRRSASGEWEEGKYTPLGILRRLEKLPPDQRVVKGELDLEGTSITSLPQGLKVGGNLWLQGTRITSLPQGLVVGGSLALMETPITSLPQDLVVGGTLDLASTRITSLPQGLKVGGNLDLEGTPITSLPRGLVVGGTLNVRETPITSLPDDLKVGGSLVLASTRITSLPQDLKANGDLNLRDTPITYLPQNLRVGGNLDLVRVRITSLPQGLEVNGNLFLEGTPVTSLPQELKVAGTIWGFKGIRSKAPPHLQRKIQ
jgi:hypothetical protein